MIRNSIVLSLSATTSVMIACAAFGLSACRRSDSIATHEIPATQASAAAHQTADATSASRAHDQSAPPESGLIELTDFTAASAVRFVHHDGSSGHHHIVETISCGLALFDYDGDGLIDIYFPNGAATPGETADRTAGHALYKNLGDMKFREVTGEAGLVTTAFGLGIAIADFDNDGHADIYLSNFGPNILYRNNGDGTFSDVTVESSVGRGQRVGAGACFLDIDADGDLDLFAANYVQFSTQLAPAKKAGRSIYPGPMDYPPETNSLFRSDGDGHWTDISDLSGVSAKRGTGMGAICCDIDDDGDTDICVANDEMANFLYLNEGRGVFEESAVYAAIAYDGFGAAQGSMGIDSGDYDNDGRMDLYVTAYQHERATLYQNRGAALFHDVSQQTGAGEGTQQNVTWGCCFADLDHDADRDLIVATGHLDQRDSQAAYLAPDVVLRNQLMETGKSRFENISHRCGDGPRLERSTRGAAVADLENDGDLDVVLLNTRAAAAVLQNQLQSKRVSHHWLQIQLRGSQMNRDAVGAKVRLVAGDLVLVDEVHSGRGYQSHWGSRLHFGLGNRSKIDRVEICWLNGDLQTVRDVAVDQIVTIVEP